jgi:hypothetical protein
MASRQAVKRIIHEMATLKSEQQAGSLKDGEGCGLVVGGRGKVKEGKPKPQSKRFEMVKEVDKKGEPTGKKVRVSHVKSEKRAAAAKARYDHPDSKLRAWNEMVSDTWRQGRQKDPKYSYKEAMKDTSKHGKRL